MNIHPLILLNHVQSYCLHSHDILHAKGFVGLVQLIFPKSEDLVRIPLTLSIIYNDTK